jgi:hypothetical protein
MQSNSSLNNPKRDSMKNELDDERMNLFKLSNLFRTTKAYKKQLERAARLIRDFFHLREKAFVRIKYGNLEFSSNDMGFNESPYKLSRKFNTILKNRLFVEVFYDKELRDSKDGLFLNEEKELFSKSAALVRSYINQLEALNVVDGRIPDMEMVIERQKEKQKELAFVSRINEILKSEQSVPKMLQQICYQLQAEMQFADFSVVRIVFDNDVFSAPKEFSDSKVLHTKWTLRETFVSSGRKGIIVIYYLKEFPKQDKGPFLKEEQELVKKLARIIKQYFDNESAKTFIAPVSKEKKSKVIPEAKKRFIQNFMNKNNLARDIFHDLMPFKVKEILLFANMYDAFSIDKEGRFSDHILGEYYQLNLTSIPRVTAVSTFDDLFQKLYSRHYDLVIIMAGTNKETPVKLSNYIKKEFQYIPVYLLLNNNAEISYYEKAKDELQSIEQFFVWNGDSRIFFTMVKLLEDNVNVENDTSIGFSRVILLVEDSAKYYSRYLPLLYTNVLEQTKRIIDEISKMDELYKILRLRARPKVLLATNYEQALDIFETYKDNMLCLITDVKFPKEGEITETAGFELVEHVRSQINDLPTVIQSSNINNQTRAIQLKAKFVDKNTEALLQEIRTFISINLGFGDFVFRDVEGKIYDGAKNLIEFVDKLHKVPDLSILYHAGKNHFSLWFKARGEMHIAKLLAPLQVVDFESAEDLRHYLIDVINNALYERTKGKIVDFEVNSFWTESSIASLSAGALGGKGRGLAFINSLLYSFDISEFIPNINLRTPRTAIIGIEEFEEFIETNGFIEEIFEEQNGQVIKELFFNGRLSKSLLKKLKTLLEQTDKPLAVRSSGLFEDSLMQPFAGVFETYILPNSHDDIKVRLQQLSEAIKLVYASVYSKISRDYIQAIHYKLEEEKMAVVIQELVGTAHGDVYYPTISGVAQSYNYYPYGHMQPDDGYAVCAIGLGTYVVSGEKSYRFCPKYPTLVNNSPKDQFKNSQVQFIAVDRSKKEINLLEGENAGLVRLDIDDAEMHGTLKHCASVYDPDNDMISPGLDKYGPRIVNFANILQYNYIPLAETITSVLDVVEEALGSPIEIEFAIDLEKDENRRATFYLLQIKPLIGNATDFEINMDEVVKGHLLLFTDNGMGNGLIDYIKDVIYVETALFDKSKTKEIAQEIEALNQEMIANKKEYILIGPGRWGTRDPWIGIPVNWTQISKAKIIVETSLDDFPLDASAGSHFFHNVTSMNVGYFSIQHHSAECFINWELLSKQTLVKQTKYLKHVRFAKELIVKMDGKKRVSLIDWQEQQSAGGVN